MKISKRSAFTGKVNTMDIPITESELIAWQNSHVLIQRMFPHLSDDQREFLLSGVTPEEWNECMGEEEDEY
jgi:hypothetical protein